MYAQDTRSRAKSLLQMHQKLDADNVRPGAKECQALNSAIYSDNDLLEQKLSQRLLGIILIWLLGWTPFAFVATVQLAGYGTRISKIVSIFAMIFCKLSSVMNTYIYGMRYVKTE